MNTSFSLFAALAVVVSCSTFADQADAKQALDKSTAKSRPVKPKQKDVSKKDRVLWTGSFIPQRLHRNGLITDSTAPLVVIDQNAIDRSGAATVAGVIRHYR